MRILVITVLITSISIFAFGAGLQIRGISLSNITANGGGYDFTVKLMVADTEGVAIEGATVTVHFDSVISPNPNDYSGTTDQYGIANISVTGVVSGSPMSYTAHKGTESDSGSTTVDLTAGTGAPSEIHLSLLPGAPTTGYLILVDEKMHTVTSATEIEYTVGGAEAATVITSGDQVFPGGTAKIGQGNDADVGKEVDLELVASPTVNTSGETNKLRWGNPDHVDITVATSTTYTTDVSTVSADLDKVSFKVTVKDANDNTVQEKLPIHWSASQILGSNLGVESGFGLSRAPSFDASTTVNGTNTSSTVDFYIGGHAGDEFDISATETGDDISAHYSHYLEIVPGAPNKLLIELEDSSQDVSGTQTGWQVRADYKREDILNISPLNLKALIADQHDNVITDYSTSSTVTWSVSSNDSRTWLMEYVNVASATKTIHVSEVIDSIIDIYYYHDPQHLPIPTSSYTFSGTEITFTSTITCSLMVKYMVKNSDTKLLRDLFGGNDQSPITGYESGIAFYPTNYAGGESYRVKAALGSWTGESTDIEILPYDYPVSGDPAAVVVQTADHRDLWTEEEHYPLQSDLDTFSTPPTSITLNHRAKTLVGVWKSNASRVKIEYIPAHKAGATDESTKTIIIDEDLAKKYGSSSITLLVEYESDDASSDVIELDHCVSAITLSSSTYPILDTEITQGSSVIDVDSIDADDRHKIKLAQKVTGQVSVKYFKAEEVSADIHQTQLNVYVYDPHRNPIPYYSVELRTRSDSLVTTLVTDSNGKANYTLETNSVAETSYDLKAVVMDEWSHEISYNCDYIVVVPGTPAKFELSAITNTDSSTEVKANPDNTVELIAQLVDVFGNEIRDSSAAWNVNWSDGTGGGVINYRTELGHNLNYLGQSIVDLTPSNSAGVIHTLHVSATTAGGSISEATPLTITVVPGDPYRVQRVVIVQGSSELVSATSVAEGEMITLRAYVQDYHNNLVSSGYDVVWDFTPHGRGARFAGVDPDTSKTTQTASNGTSDVGFYVSRLVGDEFYVTATIKPPSSYGTVTSTATSPMITVVQGMVEEVDIGLLRTETVHTAATDHIDLSRYIAGVMGVWATDTSEATNYYVYCNGSFYNKRITFSESIPSATYTIAYLYKPDTGKTYEVSTDSPSTAVYIVVRDAGKNGVNGANIRLALSDADGNPNDPYHISRSLWDRSASLSATNTTSGVYPFGNHSVNGVSRITLNTTVFAGDNYTITAQASDVSTTSSVFTVIAGSQDHVFLYSTDVGNITVDGYDIMQREHHTAVSNRIVLNHYANVEFTDKNGIVRKRIVVIGDDGKNYFKSIKSDGKTVDLKEDAPSSVTAYYFPAPELDAGNEIMLVVRNEDMYGNSTDSTSCTATFTVSATNVNDPRSDSYLQLHTTTHTSTSTLTLSVSKITQIWFRAKEADDPDPDLMVEYLDKRQRCHIVINPGPPSSLSMQIDKTTVTADEREIVAQTNLVDEFGNTVEEDFPVIWSYEEVSSGSRTPDASDLLASFSSTSTVNSTVTYSSNGITTVNFFTSTVAGAEFRITATASTVDRPSTNSSLITVKPGEVKYIAIEGERPNLSIHAGDITSPSVTDKTPYLGGVYCYTEDKYGNEIIDTVAEKSVDLSAIGGIRFAPREDSEGNAISRKITGEKYDTSGSTDIVYTHFTILSTPTVKDKAGNTITVVSYSSNRITLGASVTGVYITYDAAISNLLPPSGYGEIDGLGTTMIKARLPDRKEVEGDRGRGYVFFYDTQSGTAEVRVSSDDPDLQVDPEASRVVVTVLPGDPDRIRIYPSNEREEKLGEFNVGEATECTMAVQVRDANGNPINGNLTSVPVTFSLVGEVRDEYVRSKSATSIEVKYPISSKFGLISIYVASSEYGTPSYNYAASATFSSRMITLITPLATAEAPVYVSYYTDVSEGGVGFSSDPGNIKGEQTVYVDETGHATVDYVKFGVHTDVQNDIIAYIKDGLANEDHYVKFYATLKTTKPSKLEIVPTDKLASADVGREKYLMVYVEDDYGNVVTDYSGDVTFSVDKAGIVKGGPVISVVNGEKEVKFIGYECARYGITAVASPGEYSTEHPLYLQVGDDIPPTYVKTDPEDGTAFNEDGDSVSVYLNDEGVGINPDGCVIHVYKVTSSGSEISLDAYGDFEPLLKTVVEKPERYGDNELVLSNYIAPTEGATVISATGTYEISGISGQRIITLNGTVTADASISVQYNTLIGLKWKISDPKGFEQLDLGEGIYRVTVDKITDRAGNTLSNAGTSTFAYDTTPPSPVTVSSIVMGENDEIYVPGKLDYVISEDTLKFRGKAELGSKVVADVKTRTAEATFDTNAGYLPKGVVYQYTKEATSFELSITLSDATARATVTLTDVDSAGNVSKPVTFGFTVDRTGPVISDVNYPAEVLKESEIPISAKVTDANSGIKEVELLYKHLDNRVTEVSTIATLNENYATLRLSHGVEAIESITWGATDLYAEMVYGEKHLWEINDTTVIVKIDDLEHYGVSIGSTVTIVYDYVDERDMVKGGEDVYKLTLPASLITEDVYFRIRAVDEGRNVTFYPESTYEHVLVKASKSVTIDPAKGGKISVSNVTIDIPPDAMYNKEVITVRIPTVERKDGKIYVVLDGKKIDVTHPRIKMGTAEATITPVCIFADLMRGSSEGKIYHRVFRRPVTITVGYPDDDNDGFVDGTEVNENKLRLFFYDGYDWVYVNSSVSPDENVVTGKVSHFTLFGIFAVDIPIPDSSKPLVTDIKLEGNPLNPNEFGMTIRYTVTRPAKVRIGIYNSAGTLMNILRDDDTFTEPGFYSTAWYGDNRFGDRVPSGAYILLLRAQSESGDVMLERRLIVIYY